MKALSTKAATLLRSTHVVVVAIVSFSQLEPTSL